MRHVRRASRARRPVNVLGTIRTCSKPRDPSTRRSSSARRAARSTANANDPRPRTTPREPLAPVRHVEARGEEYLATWNRLYGTNHVALRFGNVYGPRQLPNGEAASSRSSSTGSAPAAAHDLRRRQSRRATTSTSATSSRAVLASVGQEGGVFNVGTGVETSVIELFAALPRGSRASRSSRACAGPRRATLQRSVLDPGLAAGAGLAPGDILARAPRDLALAARPDDAHT